MTDTNLSELIVILDRSGSMQSIQRDMEGGFAKFIKERHSDPTNVRVSLYQFDDVHEVVYENRPVREVHGLTLSPRGSTALYDAVARTVQRVGARLAALPEHARPGAVVVMIITDGEENASVEYGRFIGGGERVRAMIEHQEQKYNWKFLFLGSDKKAFEQASELGISMQRSARYQHNAIGTKGLWDVASQSVGHYYGSVHNGVIGADLSMNAAEGVEVGGVAPQSSTTGK